MICRLLLLLLSIVAGVTSSAFAVWVGKGEVVGQVTSSGLSNDRVHFVLTIESQTNELGGPQLGDANTFTYAGTRKGDVSVGDRLRLRVNLSNNEGIVVESLEFLEDLPATPSHPARRLKRFDGSALALLGFGLLGGLALIVFLTVRSRRNRKDNKP